MASSLEKSHSKMSNFKLTLLSIFELISFQAFWLVLGFKEQLGAIRFTALLIAFIALFVISILMMRKFKR